MLFDMLEIKHPDSCSSYILRTPPRSDHAARLPLCDSCGTNPLDFCLRFPRGIRLAIPDPLYFVVALLLGDDSIDVILLKVGNLAAATKFRPVVQDHTRVVLLEVELFGYSADPGGFGAVFEFDSEGDLTCFFLNHVVFDFHFVCALPDEIIFIAVLAWPVS